MRPLGRALRLLCALAIAVVTTFHVCDAMNGRAVDLVAVSDDAGTSAPTGLAAVEKCHTCALASLPATLAAEHTDAIVRIVPMGATLHVTPFSQPAIGPPPRA